MKPPEFDYLAARTLDEAIAQLVKHDGDAKILAGGQSLTPMLNFRLLHPKMLVDINRIPGLEGIQAQKGGLKIGALTRHRAIEMSREVAERQPVLAAAAKQVGHLAIRNRGTFGGSIAHNDPAAEFPMIAMLLDATVKVKGPGGVRSITAKELFVSYLSTSLRDGEILTEVEIPDLPANTGWGFEELSRRLGDFAIAAVCATVTVKDQKCTGARIAMAGVGPTPIRSAAAESKLQGQKLTEDVIKAAAEAASGDSDPNNDVHASADFRRHLVGVLTGRALKSAWQRATGA